jgi:hypothetical protein
MIYTIFIIENCTVCYAIGVMRGGACSVVDHTETARCARDYYISK